MEVSPPCLVLISFKILMKLSFYLLKTYDIYLESNKLNAPSWYYFGTPIVIKNVSWDNHSPKCLVICISEIV